MSDNPQPPANPPFGASVLDLTTVRQESTSHPDDGFPAEPFPCPQCGQMLGPRVRVCVACRQPIDPAKIRVPAPAPTFTPARSVEAPRPRPKARFSWGIFLTVALTVLVVLSLIETRFGPQRVLYVYWAIQFISTVWVYFDARGKGIPRPLRWTIASLLIWLPFFSWYLARRRQPHAVCEPMEGESGAFLRVLLLVTAVTLLAALLLTVIAGALHVPLPK